MNNVIEAFKAYQGNTVIMILALLSAAYILIVEDRKYSERIVVIMAVSVILVYNDLIYNLIEKTEGESAFLKYVYALPASLLCSFALVRLMMEKNKTWWKRGCSCALILIIGLALYTVDVKPQSGNVINCSNESTYREMADNIKKDADSRRQVICNDAYRETEYISIAADRDIYGYLRGLSGQFRMAYDLEKHLYNKESTSDFEETEWLIYSLASNTERNEYNLIKELLDIDCVEYVVTKTEADMDEYMKLVGYSILDVYGDYTVYARDDECYSMRIGYWGYVRRVYFYLLGRRGTFNEIYQDVLGIGSGETALDEVAYKLLEADEFIGKTRSMDEVIDAIYCAINNRTATEAEKFYWKEYINKGGSYKDVCHELYYNLGEFKLEWE